MIIFVGMMKTYFDETVETFSMPVANKNIFIDAGHGEWDPGKVAKDGTLEKDINLSISKYLQSYLEQSGGFVLTTRTDDKALSDKKREDLKQRKNIANNENVDLLVSIHQNSFPKENVKGAQVFYYKGSEESKKLAECVQNRLKEIDKTNDRVAKESKDYYILKQSKMPAIIVECGFLSNTEENNNLKNEEYQKKIAWAIYLGILDYYAN
ncbi:N-acetylmuramoyl-L-alanine amidase CwlD [[Clostridium] colinum]|uniref:N-acetylmuramoyl-L-alanine amidase CwlD n=1 Tax=[Clostridium] colinum TaxID=36835 RepID=UPI0020245FA7|nr:N-acetylmuramoyl-L-alanine amidase CwlD [[Clostridium] colinum]